MSTRLLVLYTIARDHRVFPPMMAVLLACDDSIESDIPTRLGARAAKNPARYTDGRLDT